MSEHPFIGMVTSELDDNVVMVWGDPGLLDSDELLTVRLTEPKKGREIEAPQLGDRIDVTPGGVKNGVIHAIDVGRPDPRWPRD